VDPTSEKPQVRSRSYVATFDQHVLRFAPHKPSHAADSSVRQGRLKSEDLSKMDRVSDVELLFRTTSISLAGRLVYGMKDQGLGWSFFGNTAQALLNEAIGLIEHYEFR